MTAQDREITKDKKHPIVLISGGASGLSYFVIKNILSKYKNVRIVVIDNLETSTEENIKEFLKRENFTFIKYDLNNGIPPNIKSADFIMHLAALHTDELEPENIALNSLLTNAFATKNLLELARKSNAKFLLASSINVYQGVISSLSLKNYFGPTPAVMRRFSHIEAKRYAEALVWEYHMRYQLDARIARVGEIFGPKIKLSGPLGMLLRQTINDQIIKIVGDGLGKEYYVFVSDAAEGLVSALFSKNTSGKIFPISYDKGISQIELAYLIKSICVNQVRIEFEKGNADLEIPEIKNINRENLKIIKWKPKIDLENGIKETLHFYGFHAIKDKEKLVSIKIEEEGKEEKGKQTLTSIIQKEKAPIKAEVLEIKKPTSKLKTLINIKRVLTLTLLAGLALIILPILIYAINFTFGYKDLLSAREHLEKGETEKAQTFSVRATSKFDEVKTVPFSLRLILNTTQEGNLEHTAKSLKYISEALNLLVPTIKTLSSVVEALPPNSTHPPVPVQEFSGKIAYITKAKELLMLSKAEMKNIKNPPSKLQDKLDKSNEKLEEGLEFLSALETIYPNLPKFLGYSNKNTYLALFQNSNEIRSTGGFIGSLAEIKVENGKLKDILVDDVYNIDGQLDEKKDMTRPPEPIKTYLKQDFLRIRDANWDPSFPNSAQTIMKLYQKATDEKVDGVIAVDLEFVKTILNFTGPVFLAFYDETITPENLYEKAQYYSEHNYFEGSPQKKTFLSNLLYRILEKAFSKEKNSETSLAKDLYKNFEQKHILAYFNEPKLNDALLKLNWSGELLPYEQDYIYVVDNNVGATKANFYVRRSINYEIKNTGRDRVYAATLIITYDHTGKSNTWPGGPYKNYLRVYVPKGSTLNEAMKTGKNEVDITKDVKQTAKKGRAVFETAFQVNAGETVSIQFNYTLPQSLAEKLQNKKAYKLVVQKQPGTRADPVSIIFGVPINLEAANLPTGSQLSGNFLKLSRNLSKDLKIEIPLK